MNPLRLGFPRRVSAMDRTRIALRNMAHEDPELAARLVLLTLPAAVRRIPPPLDYELTVDGLGSWRITVHDGDARVEPATEANGSRDGLDFRMATDAAGLTAMAAGASPIRLMLGRRLRIRGKRRRALKLRAMAEGDDVSIAEAAAVGGEIDPDPIYRALTYLIDPEWTRGHSFTIAYTIAPGADGTGGGTWYVRVNDGERVAVTTSPPGQVDATVRVGYDTYRKLIGGEISASQGMREQLTTIDGEIHPVTLLGRWIERSQGRDDAELARERHQRQLQESRAGTWGGVVTNGSGENGAAAPTRSVPLQVEGTSGNDADGGDPALAPAGGRRTGGDLMSYGELYALWERQNWKAHELDFAVDREQWLTTPSEAQQNTIWSLGSFYIGEERVTADLAPFLLAAPSGEVEVFLATQLVDEARHAAFFDRFGAEVMTLESDDLRCTMRALEALMVPSWFETFD